MTLIMVELFIRTMSSNQISCLISGNRDTRSSGVEWPPPKSLQVLLSSERESLYFDLDEVTSLEYRRSARRAAHCIIYSRKYRSKQKALMMVAIVMQNTKNGLYTLFYPGSNEMGWHDWVSRGIYQKSRRRCQRPQS